LPYIFDKSEDVFASNVVTTIYQQGKSDDILLGELFQNAIKDSKFAQKFKDEGYRMQKLKTHPFGWILMSLVR